MEELQKIILEFHVLELQTLLDFAGKDNTGKKRELQERALELLQDLSSPIEDKIKELYESKCLMRSWRLRYVSRMPMPTEIVTIDNEDALTEEWSTTLESESATGDGTLSTRRLDSGKSESHGQTVDSKIPSAEIKVWELPFYEVLDKLLLPTQLGVNLPVDNDQSRTSEALSEQQEQHFFSLSNSQVGQIIKSTSEKSGHVPAGNQNSYRFNQHPLQVQLRVCSPDPVTDELHDNFPPDFEVHVNGEYVPLPPLIPSSNPGVPPKQPSKPLDITDKVHLGPFSLNHIDINWTPSCKRYYLLVNLVKVLNVEDLFTKIVDNGVQSKVITRERIKSFVGKGNEDVSAPLSIRVSVACPIGKSRMSYPCRATTCKHLQCFDAKVFLMMNVKKSTFLCPVCKKRLTFADLCIDGYFLDVIDKLEAQYGNDILLFPDGSWSPAVAVEKPSDKNEEPAAKRMKPTLSALDENGSSVAANLDDDIEVIEEIPVMKVGKVTPAATSSFRAALKPLVNKSVTLNALLASGSSKASGRVLEVVDLLDSSDSEEDDFHNPIQHPHEATIEKVKVDRPG